jgi:hypothetical protein
MIGLLVVAFALHNDFWWWDDASLVLGVPLSLLWHVGLCAAASLIFAGLVRVGGSAGPGVEP